MPAKKKETMKTILATVTDCNQRSKPARTIRVDYMHGYPWMVEDGEQHYTATGKRGTNTKSGLEMVEFSTADDARIWLSVDGTVLHED